MSDTLFDLDPTPAPEPEPKLSADRRRTQLQAQRLAVGIHPLSGVLGRHLPLHLGAAPADDADAAGRRCGSCRFRQLVAMGPSVKRWPKCMHPGSLSADQFERLGPPRASRSVASDVRAWWPACRDHDYGDPALGPDAARWVPGEET